MNVEVTDFRVERLIVHSADKRVPTPSFRFTTVWWRIGPRTS